MNRMVALDGDEGALEMDVALWKLMFDHVMNPIIGHIKGLLKQPKLKGNSKFLGLVGGLSTSPYFRERMTAEFGPSSPYRLQLVIPPKPLLAVVSGAARFGIIGMNEE